MLMKKLSWLLLFVPSVGSAFCFDDAGKTFNVSPHLLKSIAKVESDFDPYAYNENRNQSGKVISRDYGLMQINSSWFGKLHAFGIDGSNVNIPCLNVMLGAWVLSSNFATHGYNWNSVGAYNAGFSKRTENARKIYIQKVQRVYYSQKIK
ncbi:Twitching motility protein PilT [Vibrio owensii]|uniref:Twitching motility protein PilT n=2 Tax=Vibrio owensii TaxID=696485 RepID=A0AAU9Q956_9VIBR|nr:Twitching motility protein PilT [Vibrio owensii]